MWYNFNIVGEIMKKTNGFTLVEMIATIVILAIIIAIAVPTLKNVVDGSKDKAYEILIENIEVASRDWGGDNSVLLPTEFSSTKYIKLETIQAAGYIDTELKDPRNNRVITGCIKITYDKDKKQNKYDYTYVETCP